jgi:nucleotide-binding universal stress UspA family protein
MVATRFQKILVGVDFSDTCRSALDEALLLAAEREHAHLHVVYAGMMAGQRIELVLSDGVHPETVDDVTQHLQAYVEATRVAAMRGGEPIESERVSVHVRVGQAAPEILALAGEVGADLIVVGTHGRSGIRRLVLGSVAESIVSGASCPVLVVRPRKSEAEAP